MKKLILACLSTAVLFACATPEKYDAHLNTWVGKTETELQSKWGRPSAAKIMNNGDKVITYTKADDIYVPSEFYVYNPGMEPNVNDIYTPFNGSYDFTPYSEAYGYQVQETCQTSFLVQNNLISGWKWKGNNCVSY